jgi:hypothetical protein
MIKNIQNQLDAILHFMRKMDIEMLDKIIDPSCTSDFYDKTRLINELGNIFSKLRKEGNDFLQLYRGRCNNNSCTGYSCKVYCLIGNNSQHFFQIRLSEKNGIVTDIYDCILIKLDEELNDNQVMKSQLYIHRTNDIFYVGKLLKNQPPSF